MNQIKTVYYDNKTQPVRLTRAKYANSAVMRCVGHMQINHYGARYAEVFDEETGALHCAIKRNMKGDLTISFMRDPRNYETKYKQAEA